jgi:hypothetical protein
MDEHNINVKISQKSYIKLQEIFYDLKQINKGIKINEVLEQIIEFSYSNLDKLKDLPAKEK